MADRGHSARSILLAMGMGDFNATMVIPYLFMAPAQTDPQMSQIIMLTKHLQGLLKSMGAPLPITGSIDGNWAPYLAKAVGRDWMNMPWEEICQLALAAKARGTSIAPQGVMLGNLKPMSGFTDSIPGGKATLYVLGALLLYRHFKRA